jgi:hypothetical protein
MKGERMKAGVWHKDGPLAQIEHMADWADRSTPGAPLDDETAHKIAANLRAAVAAIPDQSPKPPVPGLRAYRKWNQSQSGDSR